MTKKVENKAIPKRFYLKVSWNRHEKIRHVSGLVAVHAREGTRPLQIRNTIQRIKPPDFSFPNDHPIIPEKHTEEDMSETIYVLNKKIFLSQQKPFFPEIMITSPPISPPFRCPNNKMEIIIWGGGTLLRGLLLKKESTHHFPCDNEDFSAL